MSSDDDNCFQCQETGHIAHYCPHIRCSDCDNYGNIAVDCPNKIPSSCIPARCRDNNTIRYDRSPYQSNNHTRHYHCDHRDRHRLSRSQSHSHNPRYRSNSCSDSHRSYLDPFADPHAAAHHATEAQAHTTTAMTHHTTDPHHAGVSPEITVDPECTHPANTITKPPKDHLPVHIKHPGNPKKEVQTSYN